MNSSSELLDAQFMQMRERCVSLAADFDRLARGAGGLDALAAERRYRELQQALAVLADGRPERARRILELMSDK
jgi:hypothetical protein